MDDVSKSKNGDKVVLGQGLPFQCTSIAEFFFADRYGNMPSKEQGGPNPKEVDTIFGDFLRVMNASYEKQSWA